MPFNFSAETCPRRVSRRSRHLVFMTEHHLTVARTARYQQLGELSAATRRVWFVSHGYGQLAAYFMRHFAFLAEADPSTVVIAPEGLSRFYLKATAAAWAPAG